MNEYMQSILENIKGYKKIYSSNINGFNGDIFREKCKDYKHTILIAKSNFNKILGGYSRMKWADFDHTLVTGGKSFVFFYDDDKLRICT